MKFLDVEKYTPIQKSHETYLKELVEYCKKRLSYYKVPRIVEFLDKMPRSSVGEILKRKLNAE